MIENCKEFLEEYFACVGNGTRAEKEKVVSELMERCEGENWSGAAKTEMWFVIIPASLVIVAATLN